MRLHRIPQTDAVLFDLDGVIIDSNPAIINAWTSVSEEYGYTLTRVDVERFIIGASYEYTMRSLFPGMAPDVKSVFHSKVDELEQDAWCDLIPGVASFIEDLKSCNIKTGLVTSSWPEKINRVLQQHNLDGFDTIVSRNDVLRGKPDPLPYLVAMEELHLKPQNCLIFEDSDNGIRSALSSGAHCIAIDNDFNNLVSVKDFTELEISTEDLIFTFSSGEKGIRLYKTS